MHKMKKNEREKMGWVGGVVTAKATANIGGKRYL